MAGTEWHFLTGKVKWVQGGKLNQWGKYSMVLYPSPESIAYIEKLQKERGIRNRLSKDEDGWWLRLNRPSELKLRTGKTVGVKPPEIFDGNQPVKDEAGNVTGYMPLNQLVGNGSDGVVKVEVYPYTPPATKDGKKEWAMRWYSLRIDNLIPFNRPSFDEGLNKAGEGLENQPRQLF